MKTRTGQKLKLTTVEELLGVPATESSTEIDVDMIHVFKNHPFKVLDDEKMSDLVESIRVNGILSPVLVLLLRLQKPMLLQVWSFPEHISRLLTVKAML